MDNLNDFKNTWEKIKDFWFDQPSSIRLAEILIAFFLLIGISNIIKSKKAEKPDKDIEVVQQEVPEVKKVERAILSVGQEATTKESVALWSEQQFKILKNPYWTDAKPITKLIGGVTVFITELDDDEFAKVKTRMGTEGFIVKESLQPANQNKVDSTLYFSKKKYSRINTYVDGMDVQQVNLWNTYNSNRQLRGKVFKGDKVIILEESADHYKVLAMNGTQGWCMKEYVN